MFARSATSPKICGVYAITGPLGVYVGESKNIWDRRTVDLALRLGLPWAVVLELPRTASKRERMAAEVQVAEEFAAHKMTVVNRPVGWAWLTAEERSAIVRRGWAKLTPEQRLARAQKAGLARRGKPVTPQARANIRAAALRRCGEALSPEHRAKISLAKRGKPKSAATRAAMRAAWMRRKAAAAA